MNADMPLQSVRLALVQMACCDGPRQNRERAAAAVTSCAKAGATIICLPELFVTRYFCQREDIRCFDLAESIPGPSTDTFGRLARSLGVVVLAPVFEKRAAGVYHNTVLVFDTDGSIAGRYRKMHIPDDPGYYEKFYFTPGDAGFARIDTQFARIGVLICWDQWFPEAARLTSLSGAQIIFCPTAIGWHAAEKESAGVEQHDAWETVQRGHAIANGVFWAAINRCGIEGDIEFWGRSFVADPLGTIVTRAGADQQSLVADCDLDEIEQVRRTWPFLRDRRIDAYTGIDKRWLD